MPVKNSTENAIHLDIGYTSHKPPRSALKMLTKALESTSNPYTSPGGLPELREKLKRKLRLRNELDVDASQIIVTVGASGALFTALASALRPNDEILLPNPGYPAYPRLCEILGLQSRFYNMYARSGSSIDIIDEFEYLVSSKTRAIIWNSPANPTGVVASRRLTEELAEFARQRNLILISDEVYEDLVFKDKHISPASVKREAKIFSVFSFSKTYGMAGWRVGYLVCPAEYSQKAQRVSWTTTMNTSTLAQNVALGALMSNTSYIAKVVRNLRDTRDEVINLLNSAQIYSKLPQGTFYLWIDIRKTGMDDQSFMQLCLDKVRVAVAPGSWFGTNGKGFIRLSFGQQKEYVLEGVRRVAELYNACVKQESRIEGN